MTAIELDTPHGPARAHLIPPSAVPAPAAAPGEAGATAAPAATPAPRATLVLGHGAGGSITAPDLQAVAAAASAAGIAVVLVEQPYRVAGRRSAAPAKQLDAAWEAVIAGLDLGDAPLITGGRSSGARVACRTATATGAAAVLCLAFPLVTPKGASRQEELDEAGVPLLVVQGTSDRFGMPEPDPALGREVVTVSGDHGLKKDPGVIAAAVVAWVDGLLAA